jgi:Abnormal spindle-like microcephaly-assoc'd, ASPM-SPD-2-Hydin
MHVQYAILRCPPAAFLFVLIFWIAMLAACGGGGGMVQTLTTPPPPAATPTASLGVASLTFSSQTVGALSAAQTLTLTDTGTGPLNITSITIGGTNSSDFAETNTCGTSVAAKANCMISVTFTPTASGTRSASIAITDNAPGSPQTIGLSGTGVVPAITVSVAPATANVQVATGTSFTATVENDSQNKGVMWALSGSGCSGATCGTLSAASSASGAPVMYTAPASVPSPAAVTLTATSAADTTKSAAAIITITVAPPPPSATSTLLPFSGPGIPPFLTALVVDNSNTTGNIYEAFADDANGTMFSRSTDGGQTFSKPRVIGRGPFGSGLRRFPPLGMLVDHAGNIDIIVHSEGLDPVGHTEFMRSTDGGVTFSTAVSVADTGASPIMAVDIFNNLYIVYFEFPVSGASKPGLYYIESTDGVNFGAPVFITNANKSPVFQPSNFATGANNLKVYAENISTNVYLSFDINFSVPTTTYFQKFAPVIAANPTALPIADPAVAIDHVSTIHMVWDSEYASSEDGGATFIQPTPIGAVGNTQPVQLGIDGVGNLSVLWFQASATPGEGTTAFAYSVAQNLGGPRINFSNPVVLSTTAYLPSMAVEANKSIDIVWFELFNTPPGIYFTHSKDGVNFSPETLVTSDPGIKGSNLKCYVDNSGHVYATYDVSTANNGTATYIVKVR